MSVWITRKEVAALADCSYDQVRKNESLWELKPFRVARGVRYRRAQTIASLIKFGLVLPEDIKP